jgi:putative redox protein
VSATTDLTDGHPSVFKAISLVYEISGPDDADKVKEAVHLSRTKYCGVIAMLEKNSEISYQIILNGKLL